jgi:hypothetical protein
MKTPRWNDMIRHGKHHAVGLLGLCALGASACIGPNDITGDVGDVTLTGTIDVGTTTTGPSIDPNGYLASLDESLTEPIEANGSVSFSPVPVRTYNVQLLDVDSPCFVVSTNPTPVLVRADSTVTVSFDVSCP